MLGGNCHGESCFGWRLSLVGIVVGGSCPGSCCPDTAAHSISLHSKQPFNVIIITTGLQNISKPNTLYHLTTAGVILASSSNQKQAFRRLPMRRYLLREHIFSSLFTNQATATVPCSLSRKLTRSLSTARKGLKHAPREGVLCGPRCFWEFLLN